MQTTEDWKDLTIRWEDHQKFKPNQIIEDDLMEVIVQKLEMILFTNKEDVLGSSGFNLGADLEYYLWETKIGNDILKAKIVEQINQFIPEMNIIGYDISLKIFEGTIQDILNIYINIKGYNLEYVFN